ncbi:transglutaminase TgpA family protein [Microbacterium invictum]|uniref:Transglutaminase-like putative cysteine protease n=1 Tax=Microbacterium invictum TaxID=515415 RepID=A0AA40SLH1_9MICO|nr:MULTISPECIES: DUF3488 and transglutaminase-like domain-containing protein [Microbacterium]MBB4138418.1 transglutaminase-like putative cysteine protease [Microbacterium invictum]
MTIGLFVAIVAALAPLTGVIAPGGWVAGVIAFAALLLGVGYAARRLRVPGLAVTLIEIALWVAVVTVVYLRDTAILGFIPSFESFGETPVIVQVAANEILLGVSPLEPTRSVTFIVVTALGALTIALDHVVLTARMPLLAAVALVAVWLIPSIAVPSDDSVISFVFLAASILYLIRAETRTREAPSPAGARAGAGVTAMAASIGAAAIALTVLTTPTLPPATAGSGTGLGVASIDATLELGKDLRQPADMEVLRVHTNAPSTPYLRAATLSSFDGEVWKPDRYRSVDLEQSAPFGPMNVDDDVRITQYRTTIEIDKLASARLPVPYPAVSIEGLGGFWRAVAANRTVVTAQSTTQGQNYVVVSHLPRPTREQIRAADATMANTDSDVFGLPGDMPPIIGETAIEVTAEAGNDYDRLIALQSWFRGPSFSYSLFSPVQAGFDGTGADAVAEFLDVREGYCVHFASSFALMARTLGMPSRIVIGFLPGTMTNDVVDGERVASVSTSMLHAWPEVHFEGIGWVPFEPTKSLGVPTSFLPETSAVPDDGGEDISGPAPSASPNPTGSAAPLDDQDGPEAGGAGPGSAPVDPAPYLMALAIALVAGVIPGAAGRVRFEVLRGRARAGDVSAAWRLVQDVAIDLGISVPGAESPRAFGARLVRRHGAPADAVGRLVAAVEYANYARTAPDSSDAGMDAVIVRRGLLAAAPAHVRRGALLLPRSLVVRPGSAIAQRPGLPSVAPAATR